MMSFLSRLFGASSTTPKSGTLPALTVDLHLHPSAEFAFPDWPQVAAQLVEATPGGSLDINRTGAARQWLEAMRPAFGARAAVSESEHFIALAGQASNVARAALAFAEKSRARVLRLLDGIARPAGRGKIGILVFDDADTYARYLRHYFPDVSEYAFPGAMYLDPGHPHFVLTGTTMSAAEPVIARELTRLHLAHLPLPTWVDAGLILTLERMLAPRACCSKAVSCDPRLQLQSNWNEANIQAFWSGRSFLASGHDAAMSGDLAAQLVALLGRDRAAFIAFANHADASDSGASAAIAHSRTTLSDLAAEVLGAGDWAPRPDTWRPDREPAAYRLPAIPA